MYRDSARRGRRTRVHRACRLEFLRRNFDPKRSQRTIGRRKKAIEAKLLQAEQQVGQQAHDGRHHELHTSPQQPECAMSGCNWRGFVAKRRRQTGFEIRSTTDGAQNLLAPAAVCDQDGGRMNSVGGLFEFLAQRSGNVLNRAKNAGLVAHRDKNCRTFQCDARHTWALITKLLNYWNSLTAGNGLRNSPSYASAGTIFPCMF